MAERRMFAKTIIDSDAFLDMPITARLLYYDLAMRADDDGFVNSPKKIMRMVGASEDDLKILSVKKFIIPFDIGVVVIKHWRIHNYIRKDTYNGTPYKDQKNMLELDENNAYKIAESGIRRRAVDEPSTQVRLGKVSIGKDSIDKEICPQNKQNAKRFSAPTLDEVKKYIAENNYNVDAERFVDYYTAVGWEVGKKKMKDWKAAVRNWHGREKEKKIVEQKPTGNEFATKERDLNYLIE